MMIDQAMIYQMAIVGVLLLLMIFFNGSETSLTGISRPLMHQLEAEGDRRAGLVNRLHDRKDRLLGSILLGNTLAQIVASSLATSLAITLFGNRGVVYGSAVMTVAVLVFCEILPKTVAIHRPNRVARVVAPVVRAVVFVLGPPADAVQAFVNGMLRLCGLRLDGKPDAEFALTELKGAIAFHTGEGETLHERKMLRSILDLGDVAVGEIMVHRTNLAMINASQPVAAILDQVAASTHTRLPLWQGEPDNIVGILHGKALLRAVHAHAGDIEGIDVIALASPPWFIPESTSLLDQMQAFRKRREHFALVVDEYGALQGVVTLQDIIEEIVGGMPDAEDRSASGMRPQPDGSYIIDGEVTIRDINRELDWHLPDENAATIAGLLLHEARTIPETGQKFLFHGFRFEVLRRQRNQLTSIRVTPPGVG